LLGVAALSAANAAEPAAASRPVQQRIDALLKRRLRPEPLPVNPPNPFQLSGGAVRSITLEEISTLPAANQAKIPAAATNLEVLAGIVARLKVGGIIALKDQIQVVVNGVPRREGDSITVEWNKVLVSVKLIRLLPGQIVLRYADAEITIKF
jgi:hypothetical protein